MTRYIGLFSGKGGVAKTTSTINLGMAMNELGKDVAIIDANFTTPNIGLYLGLKPKITIHDIIKNKHHAIEAIQRHKSGLKIIPGSISLKEIRDVKSENFKHNLADLRNTVEYALIDTSASLTKQNLDVLDAVDEVVIVTTPELPAVTDALKTIKLAEEYGKNIAGVIVCKSKNDDLEMSVKNIEAMLDYPVISVIPYDESVREALKEKESIILTHPDSEASLAYKRLAEQLTGTRYEEEVNEEGLFSKLFRALGLKS